MRGNDEACQVTVTDVEKEKNRRIQEAGFLGGKVSEDSRP